jgi:hypothetical protein
MVAIISMVGLQQGCFMHTSQTEQAVNAPKVGDSIKKSSSTTPPDNVMRRMVDREDAIAATKKQASKSKALKKKSSVKKPESEVRFVNVDTLNVRKAPNLKAPIVGTLKKGSAFLVTIKGEWAKIGPQQFVAVEFLQKSEPKGVDSGWDFASTKEK